MFTKARSTPWSQMFLMCVVFKLACFILYKYIAQNKEQWEVAEGQKRSQWVREELIESKTTHWLVRRPSVSL